MKGGIKYVMKRRLPKSQGGDKDKQHPEERLNSPVPWSAHHFTLRKFSY
jgi:hypothetical protein